jgi:hypothetical protein
MDRYLFTGTIRQDGSSNFAKDIVGDFSCLWLRMDRYQRRFYGKCKGINLLKLRGGWGREIKMYLLTIKPIHPV